MGKKAGAATALAPWFGAKRTLADRIVEAIGDHTCYWEPFCGSMAVLLSKPAVSNERVNDLHGDLVNLARVIRDPILVQSLYWRLRRTLVCEPLFRESRAVIRTGPAAGTDSAPDRDRAYHYFVSSWLGLSGVAGCRPSSNGFARRYSSKGGGSGSRFVTAVESIPDWHDRIRAVEIYSGCGIEMCERIEDREGTAIYADPPYHLAGAEYLHTFAADQHARLAAALRRFTKTRVVVSYYAHPDIGRDYPGWRILEVTTTKALVSAGKRGEAGRVDAPEVLILNRPQPEGA